MLFKLTGPIAALIVAVVASCLVMPLEATAQGICRNPGGQTFNRNPAFKAPDATRAIGALANIGGELRQLPDTRASCLPLSLRYNNPGAIKTPGAGPWAGQIDRDGRGHAVFATLTDGVAGLATWVRRRTTSDPQITAFQMMSIYAPPDDCIGSEPKLPNGQCPPGYPLNPTREYATRVAASVGKGPDEPLSLSWDGCRELRDFMFAMVREIMTFEAGYGFCGNGLCSVDRQLFEAAMDRVAGSMNAASCSARG